MQAEEIAIEEEIEQEISAAVQSGPAATDSEVDSPQVLNMPWLFSKALNWHVADGSNVGRRS